MTMIMVMMVMCMVARVMLSHYRLLLVGSRWTSFAA
jgi:hypothetical protein